MKKLLITLLAINACGVLHAQTAAPSPATKPVLPPGPLLKPVPDNIRWTVTTTGVVAEGAKPEKAGEDANAEKAEDKAKPEKAKGVTTMTGAKVGNTGYVLTTRANGVAEQTWTDGTLSATVSGGAREPVFTTGGALESMPKPTWVSAENFADITKQGEKSFLVFRTRVIPAGLEVVIDMERNNQAAIEKMKVDATAVIDADARLPIALKEGEATTTYKYEALPPGTQIIPAAILSALSEHGQKLKDSIRKPVTP